MLSIDGARYPGSAASFLTETFGLSRGIGYLWEGLVLKESKKGRTTGAGFLSFYLFPFLALRCRIVFLCPVLEVFDATLAARKWV